MKANTKENNNFNYDIKEKIVKAGGSEIFKNWHENAGITEEEFLDGLKWICESEFTERGQVIRELGCSRAKGLVKLNRVFDKDGNFIALYRCDNRSLWSGVSLSPRSKI